MPENTVNTNTQEAVENATETVVTAATDNSSLTGILEGVAISLVCTLAGWGVSKLYKKHKDKKAMKDAYDELDDETLDVDYTEEDAE